MQTEPFIHVDGDIYISKRIPGNIENAMVLVQNQEIGTEFYHNIVSHVLNTEELIIDDSIRTELSSASTPSFNMGFFGGNDITCIRRYCQGIFNFFQKNELNSLEKEKYCSNVFFEQILFAVFAKMNDVDVSCVRIQPVNDNGYSTQDFCNLTYFNAYPFFHILGNHKQNIDICALLKEALINMSIESYFKVISLFPEKNIRFSDKLAVSSNIDYMSVERSIADFEDFKEQFIKHSKASTEDLYYNKRSSGRYLEISNRPIKDTLKIKLKSNKNIAIYSIPMKYHPKAKQMLRDKYRLETQYPLSHIVLVATLDESGFNEIPILKEEKDVIDFFYQGAFSLGEFRRMLIQGSVILKDITKKRIIEYYRHIVSKLVHKEIIIILDIY